MSTYIQITLNKVKRENDTLLEMLSLTLEGRENDTIEEKILGLLHSSHYCSTRNYYFRVSKCHGFPSTQQPPQASFLNPATENKLNV